jgi:hypothetical protein
MTTLMRDNTLDMLNVDKTRAGFDMAVFVFAVQPHLWKNLNFFFLQIGFFFFVFFDRFDVMISKKKLKLL